MREDRQRLALSLTTTHPGRHQVDLVLNVATLNEHLLEIGLWLIEWEIPHQAKVRMLPRTSRIRVSFPDARHARAFLLRFDGEMVEDEIATAMSPDSKDGAADRLGREHGD